MMGNRIFRIFKSTILVLALSLSSNGAWAQQNGDEDIIKESMTDLGIVAGVTMGGAILGLSTLSFAEEPSEKTDNILIGGAFGLIVGVGIVAMLQATKSKDMYYEAAFDQKSFGTSQRYAWHKSSHSQFSDQKVPSFSYSFRF